MERLLRLRASLSFPLAIVSPLGLALLAIGFAFVVGVAQAVTHGTLSIGQLVMLGLAVIVCLMAVSLKMRRMPWLAYATTGYALFMAYVAVALMVPREAYAQTAGIDVTSDLQTALMTVISGAIIAVVYFVRDWAKTHTAGQSEMLDWNTVTAWLEAAAHSAVFDHLVAGKTVTIDTKSELGNQLLGAAKTGIEMEVNRLGLTDRSLATYAEAAVAKVLNTTPTAPPFVAPPAPVAAAAAKVSA